MANLFRCGGGSYKGAKIIEGTIKFVNSQELVKNGVANSLVTLFTDSESTETTPQGADYYQLTSTTTYNRNIIEFPNDYDITQWNGKKVYIKCSASGWASANGWYIYGSAIDSDSTNPNRYLKLENSEYSKSPEIQHLNLGLTTQSTQSAWNFTRLTMIIANVGVGEVGFVSNLYDVVLYDSIELECDSFKTGDIIHVTDIPSVDTSNGVVVNGVTYDINATALCSGDDYLLFNGISFELINSKFIVDTITSNKHTIELKSGVKPSIVNLKSWLSSPHFCCSAIDKNGLIHLFNARNTSYVATYAKHYVFNLLTTAVSTAPDTPVYEHMGGVTAACADEDGNIMLVGGGARASNNAITLSVYKFDIVNNSWTTVATAPFTIVNTNLPTVNIFVRNGEIYVIARPSTLNAQSINIYKVANNTFVLYDTITTNNRQSNASVYCKKLDSIYFISASMQSTSYNSSIYKYDVGTKSGGGVVSYGTGTTSEWNYANIYCDDVYLYVVGGGNSDGARKRVFYIELPLVASVSAEMKMLDSTTGTHIFRSNCLCPDGWGGIIIPPANDNTIGTNTSIEEIMRGYQLKEV